jgi:hypothetical protein
MPLVTLECDTVNEEYEGHEIISIVHWEDTQMRVGLRNASLAEAAPTVGCMGGRLIELPDHSPRCTSSFHSAATPT